MNHFIVHERLEEIRQNLEILEELRQHPIQKFIQDPKIHKLAERCLQLCRVSTKKLIVIASHPPPSTHMNIRAVDIARFFRQQKTANRNDIIHRADISRRNIFFHLL